MCRKRIIFAIEINTKYNEKGSINNLTGNGDDGIIG